MKKSLVSTAFIAMSIFFAANSGNAQQGFMLGVEGTPQMSWLVNQDDRDNSAYESMEAFNSSFGIRFQYGFTDNIGIGLNGLYSFQGQHYKINSLERIKKLEYIKIPLMFVYTYGFGNNMAFIGKIGPQLGLIMNASLVDQNDDVIVSDQKKAYMNYDFGGMVSAGIGAGITGNLTFDASVRFDYGFTDAEDKDYTDYIHNPLNGGGTGAISNSDRAITNNMTAGLNIGINYFFAR